MINIIQLRKAENELLEQKNNPLVSDNYLYLRVEVIQEYYEYQKFIKSHRPKLPG